MKKLLTLFIMLFSLSAHAEGYVRCEYNSPTIDHQSFIEEKSNASQWLKDIKKDHSIPNFDPHPRCYPLDDRHIYNFLSQSEIGQVSIIHNLTEEQCKTMQHELAPVSQHCGSYAGYDGCSWLTESSDIKWSKCFK